MLVAALAAGCSKEDTNSGSISGGTRNNVMRIFAGQFQNGNSKVTYNPNVITDPANWVAGEYIDINGEPYEIKDNPDNPGAGEYCIVMDPLPSYINDELYALYPSHATPNVEVTVHNTYNNREIILNRLFIKGYGENSEMVFPMAEVGDHIGGEFSEFHFKHLCGGFRITLTDITATAVDSIRIVALSGSPVVNHHIELDGEDVTARWESEGNGISLVLPAGPVGENEQDVSVANFSEMNFDVLDGALMAGQMCFCVPVTITSIRSLIIVGWSDGQVIFKKTKDFGAEIPVARNHMYNLPAIEVQ